MLKKIQQISDEFDYSYLNKDYNNIHDPTQLQRIITQLKAIIKHKIEHINQLTAQRDQQTEEREVIMRKMNQTHHSNTKKIQQYSQLIYSINDSYSKFNKDADDEKDKQKKAIEIAHQQEVSDMNKKIQDLQIEYKKLKPFEDQQSDYINKIQTMKKQIINKQYQHNDGMNLLQATEAKESQQLQQKMTQQISTTLKTAPAHAMNKISSELKTNEQQNIELKQKLFTLQTQLQKLKKQRNQILNKRKQLKINVTLNQDQLQQYKAVGSLQKAKIKAYKEKIENMKIAISEQVAKKEKQLADLKQQRESNLKVLKLKLFNLQKEKQELKIKIQKVNILAETILQQRAQIEEFFVMALDSCKKQIEESEKGRLPKIEQSKSYGDKVDIDELLPKDKQRILTNLYTKLAFGSSK